jgi:agmatinase
MQGGRTILFADANSNYKDADYVIFAAPFDGTSCFRRGSSKAPQAIREESYNFETYHPHFNIDFSDLKIHDAGDLNLGEQISTALPAVESTVTKHVADGKTPIMLGGEHSLTLPAAKQCKPDGILILDAHLDLRSEYEGEKYSHACTTRHLLEQVTENIVQIGIRSGSKEEYTFAKQHDLRYYTADYIYEKGITSIIEEIKDYIGPGKLYISLDMDAIDPAYAPGIGTPEPYGITPRDTREVLWNFARQSIGFDIVEIIPEIDINTASLGAKLIRELIAAKAHAQQYG